MTKAKKILEAQGITSFYMHTIDGEAAFFDGEQIVFAAGVPRQLESSLQAIRRNEVNSSSFRINAGWSEPFSYGYVRIPLSALPLPGDEK